VSKASDERETPQTFFEELNEEFHFTLDVAAADLNTKCPHYYTSYYNGLICPWNGRVWCNPPYSEIGKWLQKATEEIETNPRCEVIVMLLPADPSTKWFEKWVEKPNRTIRWVRPRLKFSTPDGPYKAGAKQPSMLVIFEEKGRNAKSLHRRTVESESVSSKGSSRGVSEGGLTSHLTVD